MADEAKTFDVVVTFGEDEYLDAKILAERRGVSIAKYLVELVREDFHAVTYRGLEGRIEDDPVLGPLAARDAARTKKKAAK